MSDDVQTAKLAEVEPGTCFAFDLNGKTIVGLAIEAPRRGSSPWVLALPHPDIGQPSEYDSSVASGPIVVFQNAVVEAAAGVTNMKFAAHGSDIPLGSLVVQGNASAICGSPDGKSRNLYRLDGTRVDGYVSDVAYFTSWRIVQPNDSGEPYVVLEWPISRPA